MPNITLSVDEQVIKKVRKIAVDRNTTLTELVRSYLVRLAEEDTVQRELTADEIEENFKLFSRDMGVRRWKREDLYDR